MFNFDAIKDNVLSTIPEDHQTACYNFAIWSNVVFVLFYWVHGIIWLLIAKLNLFRQVSFHITLNIFENPTKFEMKCLAQENQEKGNLALAQCQILDYFPKFVFANSNLLSLFVLA